jgi:glycerol kinase
MKKSYILSLDQGTTSSRAILYDREGKAIKAVQKEFTQIYPKAGWNMILWRFGDRKAAL